MVSLSAQWQEITIAVVLMMFALVGLVHMLGVAFSLNRLKAWAKNEFYQAAASAIIAGSMLILISSLNGAINAVIGPPTSGLLCGSSYKEHWFGWPDVMLCDIRNHLLSSATSLYLLNIIAGLVFSFGLYYMPFQQGVSFTPLVGLNPILDLIGLLTTIVGAAGIFAITQSFLLRFIHDRILLFFPVGIALRALPFTRSAGGALIALVIGLYYVYPGLMTIQALVYFAHKPSSLLGAVADTAQRIVTNPGDTLGIILNEGLGYKAIIHGILFPVINLTLTLSFIREFATFLGGEIDIRALEKLI